MGKKITINEALTAKQTLAERYEELKSLRNENSAVRTTRYGLKGDVPERVEPLYDVVALDRLVSRVAAEKRKLDAAIKATNAVIRVRGYEWDEAVLGELVPSAPKPKFGTEGA
jgi:hypothetical protein